MRARTFAALMVALLMAWPVVAQEQRGSIEGVIKDSSGAVLPGVSVEARANTGVVLTSVTDAAGVYRFPSLAPGVYELTANLQGFAAKKAVVYVTTQRYADAERAIAAAKKTGFKVNPQLEQEIREKREVGGRR